jgi:hypothetical protein
MKKLIIPLLVGLMLLGIVSASDDGNGDGLMEKRSELLYALNNYEHGSQLLPALAHACRDMTHSADWQYTTFTWRQYSSWETPVKFDCRGRPEGSRSTKTFFYVYLDGLSGEWRMPTCDVGSCGYFKYTMGDYVRFPVLSNYDADDLEEHTFGRDRGYYQYYVWHYPR